MTSKVLKCKNHKQTQARGVDKFKYVINLMQNYCDFDCVINSIFCMIRACSEVFNFSLNTASEMEVIAVAIMLHLHKSLCEGTLLCKDQT